MDLCALGGVCAACVRVYERAFLLWNLLFSLKNKFFPVTKFVSASESVVWTISSAAGEGRLAFRAALGRI